MVFEFKLPDIGEGVVEGEIITWYRKAGEQIEEDDPLVEVMTDKATVTIPSPRSGRIEQICFEEGSVAPVGELLVTIAMDATAAENVATVVTTVPAEELRPQAPAAPAAPAEPRAPAKESFAPSVPAPQTPAKRALATPATRRLARELGVDIHGITGTGRMGRVTPEDVQAASEAGPTPDITPAAASAEPPTVAPTKAPAAPPIPPRPAPPASGEERLPIRGLRKRIFDAMAHSTQTAAHFTYVDEIDMTRLVETRDRLKPRALAQGVSLTYLPFFMKSVTLAARDYPHVNARMDDASQELVVCHTFNISVAVATEQGLTVPVVHGVESKSIFELANHLQDVGERGRNGQLRREDFSEGTFTITSLGKLGGMFATPIVNYPEVAILGIHAIEDRPVVIDGEIVIRKRMYMSASFDHRVIDGHVGAAFCARVKDLLEDPDALMMELR
jgi:pyruvate dehydrogenase E2 component (dihydrolipoamide acetyltransferase)